MRKIVSILLMIALVCTTCTCAGAVTQEETVLKQSAQDPPIQCETVYYQSDGINLAIDIYRPNESILVAVPASCSFLAVVSTLAQGRRFVNKQRPVPIRVMLLCRQTIESVPSTIPEQRTAFSMVLAHGTMYAAMPHSGT